MVGIPSALFNIDVRKQLQRPVQRLIRLFSNKCAGHDQLTIVERVKQFHLCFLL